MRSSSEAVEDGSVAHIDGSAGDAAPVDPELRDREGHDSRVAPGEARVWRTVPKCAKLVVWRHQTKCSTAM